MSTALRLSDFVHALPILFVAAWACLTLLADALGQGKSAKLWPLAALGLGVGMVLVGWSWIDHAQPATEVFGGMLIVDRYALFLDGVFILSGLLTLLLSGAYAVEHRFAYAEQSSLILLVITGMMLLVHAGDFVLFVIGLETMSIGVYSLTAAWTGNRKSAESGLKYVIMGAVATAFLLYGIALLYGKTGQTSFRALAQAAPQSAGDPMFILGMFMVLGAMGFKVALVPFHAWTPDVYEGAPTPVTGFMATAVKAAGFGALLRVMGTVFGAEFFTFGSTGWANILWTLAVLTMTVGNLTALRQNNVKRMLAFSSVSHAGYILVGVLAARVLPDETAAGVLYYLLAYTVTTIGAFGMVAWLGSFKDERVGLEDWAGLATRHPAAAAAMTLFLLSLGGIPPTAGFFAKFYIFKAALGHEGLLSLVIIAALNSVISIYYYLKPVVAMYFREESRPAAPLRSGAVSTALVLAAILVLLLGLTPGQYLEWATQSAMAFVGR
jgi:NADH-quinone oxidoreductase subunit N